MNASEHNKRRLIKLCSILLALYAAGYVVLMLAVATSPGQGAILAFLFVVPAVTAIWALARISSLMEGRAQRRDLLVAAGLGVGTVVFALILLSEVWLLAQAGFPLRPTLFSLAIFGVPTVLWAWMGALFLNAGLKAARVPSELRAAL